MRRHVLTALYALTAATIAGCGSGGQTRTTGGSGATHPTTPTRSGPPHTHTTHTTSMRTVPRLTTTAPERVRPRRHHPRVGTTQSVESRGARLHVTLERVIDPLRGSGAALPPGTRAVGVLVRISSDGPALYDSSATGDFSVVASSGIVTPVLATRGVCETPLDDFDRYITAGETRSGCVAFAVNRHAHLVAVRFSPHAAAAGRLTWTP